MPSLVTKKINLSVKEALDKLEGILTEKGIHIFARFPHSALAYEQGLELNDAEVLVFGDPKVGTLLMQEDILIAIDLPLRFLVWSNGTFTNISYPDVHSLATQYNIAKNADVVNKISLLMNDLVSNLAKE